jgi:hypothetical protein
MTKRKTQTVNDLSRCLDPLEMGTTLIAAIAMSQIELARRWDCFGCRAPAVEEDRDR